MLTTISPALAVTINALGGSFSGGGSTFFSNRGSSYKRIRSLRVFSNENTDDDSLLFFNSPAPVYCSPNTFVSYNSLTLRLRRIGEEKDFF